MLEQNIFSVLYSQYCWGMVRFVPVVLGVDRGYYRCLVLERLANKNLCLKDRNVLLSINHLLKALLSCVVKMHSEITN
jgi:hypothetical protein